MSTASTQGELWSAAAQDWADLQEPMHNPLFEAMIEAAQVGQDTHVLDVGCGAGSASRIALQRGARVKGLDAASALIEIARNRMPEGDFRVGDLEALPYEADTFDVVLAANCIQYAADPVKALRKQKQVCRDGGTIVIGLLGQPDDVDYRAVFQSVASALPIPPPGDGPFGLSKDGKVADLCQAAGLHVVGHDKVNCPMQFADLEMFWRAARSGGPVIGAIRKVGEEKVKQSVLSAVKPFITEDGGVNLGKNHFQFVVAEVRN